jgi:hypothetical protein
MLTDNTDVTEFKDNTIIKEFLNLNLSQLNQDRFIIFPPILEKSEDLEDSNFIFELKNNKVYTQNIVGIIGKENDRIRIKTRFYNSSKSQSDYFLLYMLQKVLNYNIIKNRTKSNNVEYYDLLVYLFPFYLKRAMKKGLYKEYRTKEYNNLNVRGTIDIIKNINKNLPFHGKIAYKTREFSFDNKVTQIIRHALEKIKQDYNFEFFNDTVLKENTRILVQNTKKYEKSDLFKVLKENIINPVRHSYFEEYYDLQKLCIQILKNEKIDFGNNDNKIHGIIIDVAWLWEEYLNTMLINEKMIHPKNKKLEKGISLFSDRQRVVYPDFYSSDKKIILDAKYKKLGKSKKEINREDLYQLISYLHILESEKSGVIYPDIDKSEYNEIGQLNGYGGKIFKISLRIPQEVSTYEEFASEIRKSEEEFLNNIKNFKINIF